jgi:uncharacterized protein (DUF1697 family)
MKYVTLLRGVNVGGKNQIRMPKLKACFEKMGFADVFTYIQSGNVIFTTDEKNADMLIEKIEAELSSAFNYRSRVVLLSQNQLEAVVKDAPKGFGTKPDCFRYDVIFIKNPLTPNEAIKNLSVKEGVDEVSVGKGVLYASRLVSRLSQSHLSRIVATPAYQNMTIRNWNTTTKLLLLMDSFGQM